MRSTLDEGAAGVDAAGSEQRPPAALPSLRCGTSAPAILRRHILTEAFFCFPLFGVQDINAVSKLADQIKKKLQELDKSNDQALKRKVWTVVKFISPVCLCDSMSQLFVKQR